MPYPEKSIHSFWPHARPWLALALAAALAPAPAPLLAQDVPQSVSLPTGINTGGTSFLDGFSRTTPGWAVIEYLRYYDLDAVKNAYGADVAALRDPRIRTTALLTQVTYVSSYQPFGGVLGFNAIVPLVNLNASFAADSPARLSDSGFGLGDLTVGPYIQLPPVLRDGRPVFVQRFEIDAIAPIGKFDSDRNLNPSSGYWSLVPQWAFTVLPTPDWEISARVSYIYNFRADKAPNVTDTDDFTFHNGQAGDAAWVNFASSVALTPAFRLGVNGYYLKQLRDDRTNGQRVAGTKQTQFYAGPGASWKFDEHNIVNVNLYLPIEVKNAAAGKSLNVQYVHVF
ncbi:MAG: transporter [Comamonas sp.]